MEPYAFEVLCSDVEQWPSGDARDKWLPILRDLSDLLKEFVESVDAADRQAILDHARDQLRTLGAERVTGERFLYAATNPIGEECFRECNFRISAI